MSIKRSFQNKKLDMLRMVGGKDAGTRSLQWLLGFATQMSLEGLNTVAPAVGKFSGRWPFTFSPFGDCLSCTVTLPKATSLF